MAKSIKNLIHDNMFYNYQESNKLQEWEKGCVIPLPEFIEYIEKQFITDYDGFGKLLYRNRVLDECKLFLMCGDSKKAHIEFNGYNIRLTTLLEIFKNDVAMVWYNK